MGMWMLPRSEKAMVAVEWLCHLSFTSPLLQIGRRSWPLALSPLLHLPSTTDREEKLATGSVTSPSPPLYYRSGGEAGHWLCHLSFTSPLLQIGRRSWPLALSPLLHLPSTTDREEKLA